MAKKENHKREQIQIASALFELGMDFDVIKNISGVDATDLLLAKAGMLNFDDENLDSNKQIHNNIEVQENNVSYQESRHKGTNKRDSNPDK